MQYFFFRKSCRLWDTCGKIWSNQTGHSPQIIRRREGAIFIPGNYSKNTERIIFNADCLPRQQWLRERASMLRYTTLPILFDVILVRSTTGTEASKNHRYLLSHKNVLHGRSLICRNNFHTSKQESYKTSAKPAGPKWHNIIKITPPPHPTLHLSHFTQTSLIINDSNKSYCLASFPLSLIKLSRSRVNEYHGPVSWLFGSACGCWVWEKNVCLYCHSS
jgi:hypothetical protein